MKKRLNLLIALLLAVVMTLSLIPGAAAAEGDLLTTVDPETFEGSITVTLEYNKKPVKGIEVTLYQVGTGDVENNNLVFSLVDSLSSAAETGLNGLTAAQVEELTETLYTAIRKLSQEERAALTVEAKDSDKDGKVVFESLDVGVYLVVKTERGSDYDFDPSLVFLPYGTEKGWDASPVANPKMSYDDDDGGGKDPIPPEVIPDNPPPTGTIDPEDPTETIPEEEPPLAVLPQTGLLQWPIPVMAIAGLLLVMVGVLCERKRRT